MAASAEKNPLVLNDKGKYRELAYCNLADNEYIQKDFDWDLKKFEVNDITLENFNKRLDDLNIDIESPDYNSMKTLVIKDKLLSRMDDVMELAKQYKSIEFDFSSHKIRDFKMPMLPDNIIHLKLKIRDGDLGFHIDNLPPNILILELESCENITISLSNLPQLLMLCIDSWNCIEKLDSLPESLIYLNFKITKYKFNICLPSNLLEYHSFLEKEKIDCWPSTLIKYRNNNCNARFNNSFIPEFPSSLKTFCFSGAIDRESFCNLPDSISYIHINYHITGLIKYPAQLKTLYLSEFGSVDLEHVPETVEKLTLEEPTIFYLSHKGMRNIIPKGVKTLKIFHTDEYASLYFTEYKNGIEIREVTGSEMEALPNIGDFIDIYEEDDGRHCLPEDNHIYCDIFGTKEWHDDDNDMVDIYNDEIQPHNHYIINHAEWRKHIKRELVEMGIDVEFYYSDGEQLMDVSI
jgi:hypothetical protein